MFLRHVNLFKSIPLSPKLFKCFNTHLGEKNTALSTAFEEHHIIYFKIELTCEDDVLCCLSANHLQQLQQIKPDAVGF